MNGLMIPANHVILVDTNDVALGIEEKLTAHRTAKLHRAFSVFVFDATGRLLLQQRAAHKYHSAGLWSNTVCSHPRPGEGTGEAAHRRLVEEMGFDCPIVPAFEFTYRADLGSGMHEHEYDHVFVGRFDGTPVPDAAEVAAWRWTGLEELRAELGIRPQDFTFWFRIAFEEIDRRFRSREAAPQSHQPWRYHWPVQASR
jgi:isopentenyl-diphosphate Delta-isomerase